jgi:hypothetical protein
LLLPLTLTRLRVPMLADSVATSVARKRMTLPAAMAALPLFHCSWLSPVLKAPPEPMALPFH